MAARGHLEHRTWEDDMRSTQRVPGTLASIRGSLAERPCTVKVLVEVVTGTDPARELEEDSTQRRLLGDSELSEVATIDDNGRRQPQDAFRVLERYAAATATLHKNSQARYVGFCGSWQRRARYLVEEVAVGLGRDGRVDSSVVEKNAPGHVDSTVEV